MHSNFVANRTDPMTNTLVALAALLEGPFDLATNADVFAAIRDADSPLLAPVLAWQTTPIDLECIMTAVAGTIRSRAVELFMSRVLDSHVRRTYATRNLATTLVYLAYTENDVLMWSLVRHATPRDLYEAALRVGPRSGAAYARLVSCGAPSLAMLEKLNYIYVEDVYVPTRTK